MNIHYEMKEAKMYFRVKPDKMCKTASDKYECTFYCKLTRIQEGDPFCKGWATKGGVVIY